MKYGQIAGNKEMNALIYHCFDYICEEDARRFVKKFKEQPHDSSQIEHTVRELVLGAYLSSCDLTARHDHIVENKTPDWCILSEDSAIMGIVELVNFHIDKRTESDIEQQRKEKGVAVFRRDGNKNNLDRLYQSIQAKAAAYKKLVLQLKTPYVIALFADFKVVLDIEEIESCLVDKKIGLFHIYPEVSGVLYFRESGGRYRFDYMQNTNARYAIDISRGVFP